MVNNTLVNKGATGSSNNGAVYNNANVNVTDIKVGSGSMPLSASARQYVSIPSTTTGSAGISLACWFKSTGSGNWARILDFGNSRASDNIIMAIFENNLALSVFNGNTIGNQPLSVISNVNDGVWRHVVWTVDPAGVWVVYLNGVVVWQATGYAYPKALTRTSNFLGKSNWDGDPYFNGGLDEFRMYGRVLTSSDVQLVYTGDASFATRFGSISCVTNSPSNTPTNAPSSSLN